MMLFLVSWVIFIAFGGATYLKMGDMFRAAFNNIAMSVETDYQPLVSDYFVEYIGFILPLYAALIGSVIIISRLQFTFEISWKAIQPKSDKINPFKNFKKVLISKQSAMESVKFTAKILVMGFLAWLAIQPLASEFPAMFQFTPNQIGIIIWNYTSAIWLLIILFMVVLGIGDFAFQYNQMEEKMKMTPFEVKDETKQAMGDPKVKQKQRQKSMEMLQKLMQQGAKEADVVITNPTHFAVALAYKHGKMNAPKVVARGVDHLALSIRRTARKNEVPIVENRALARSLYYSTELGSEIPDRLFKPVAEILAFIYKLKQEQARA